MGKDGIGGEKKRDVNVSELFAENNSSKEKPCNRM